MTVKLVTADHSDAAFETMECMELTADGGVEEWKFRGERLLVVKGFLRARLPDKEFSVIYRLHDHKGSLTVGVRCGRYYVDHEKVEREVAAAWEAVNEYDSNVHYAPDWT